MTARLDYRKFSKEPLKALLDLEAYLGQCGLDPKLLHMIKLRASQINGCAYCIDMHWKDARAAGETEQRLYGLDAWRESPYYTDRELGDQFLEPDRDFYARRAWPLPAAAENFGG
jgi:AhpD family alkylhydroperoxidase